MRQVEQIRVDFIEALPGRRAVNPDAVRRLAESIKSIGLRTPITVRIVDGYKDKTGVVVDGQPLLVTGAHRLAAVQSLGWEKVECFIFDGDDEIEAQLWEISENLHRAELSTIERAEQIAEWVRLTEERGRILAQVAPKIDKDGTERGRPEGGIRAASRELGIDRDKVRRSITIASLSDEAKEAAREVGLDNNQSALERAAKADDQAAELRRIHSEKEAAKLRLNKAAEKPVNPIIWSAEDEATLAALEQAWATATPIAKSYFRQQLELDAI